MTAVNIDVEFGTEVDISIAQGATFTVEVTATSGDDNDPYDLTGLTAHLQIRRRAGAADPPLVDCSSAGDSPDIIIQPEDGEGNPQVGLLDIRIPATKTIALTKNSFYDMFLLDPDDPTEAIRLLNGAVTVSRSVTVN